MHKNIFLVFIFFYQYTKLTLVSYTWKMKWTIYFLGVFNNNF